MRSRSYLRESLAPPCSVGAVLWPGASECLFGGVTADELAECHTPQSRAGLKPRSGLAWAAALFDALSRVAHRESALGASSALALRRRHWGRPAEAQAIEGIPMNAAKLVGIVLIVAGVLGLVYGSFSYTKDTEAVKLGPLELSVKQKETVNVPVWAGIGAIVVGAALLVLGGKKG